MTLFYTPYSLVFICRPLFLQTIDCFTRPGCVQLVADTEEEVTPCTTMSVVISYMS